MKDIFHSLILVFRKYIILPNDKTVVQHSLKFLVFFSPALGMMKPMLHPDHLNSPGSDDGCHPSMHQERRAPSTEPYPMWNQDGYPLRSFTPPYQRQHESSEGGRPDDR